MQTQTRNLPEFHSVWADSLVSIINNLAKEESSAKKIMVFNIRQAYILYRMDEPTQRLELDNKMIIERDLIKKAGKKEEIGYDFVLHKELEDMKLDKLTVDELEVKMFTYMTLAGIKPVQSTQNRAAGFTRFMASPQG
jgi:hypothetical protein